MFTLSDVCFGLILIVSAAICCSDIKCRRIKNSQIAILAVACMVFQVINGIEMISFITAITALIVGLFIFQLGYIGAGDVKLYSAYLLAISPTYSTLSLYIILVIGAIEACGYLAVSVITNSTSYIRERGIPYGVAISLACVCCIWLSYN